MAAPIAELKNAISALPTSSEPIRGTELPYDAAWAPTVPIGHTTFTWIGRNDGKLNPVSQLLGVLAADGVSCPTVAAPKADVPEPVAVKAAEPVKAAEQPKAAKAAAPTAKAEAAPVEVVAATLEHLGQLDFVVGKIVSCKRHENADSLYVEQIDVGAGRGGERQIVSGLVKYLTLDQMVGSLCIVIANLKPSALRGEKSFGMVLAASNPDHTQVVLVQPPAGAQPGDRIVPVDGTVLTDAAAVVDPKKKGSVWPIVAPQLKTTADGKLAFGDVILGLPTTGPASASILNATVS